jgi:hypothetical protein
LKGGAEEQTAVALRGSVLARLAALCNQQEANSVSPYGGQGEFIDERPPATTFRIAFCNTPDEQWLEIAPLHATQAAENGST